ncbi:hypothetical protein Sros01_12680 [Streptomyces roseochromogenus]|nr:hypothetical protein [Streptomyces lavendulae]GLX35195.1 hypothetical protein Sros01_12680 [Streptomyces roseochromogenus]
MGSLRNPVGPLPSSIYWRRRAVLASVAALLALLAVWTVSSGGGTSSTNGKGGGDGSGPVRTITPGPSGSGPAISQAPGGRGDSGAASGSASGGGGKNGEPGGGSGSGPGSGSASGSGGSGSAAGGSPAQVPADSPLPTCPASALQWEVKSVKNEYETNEKPRLELLVRNISGSTCKFGLGPRQAVVTIFQTQGAKAVWSSADCPANAANAFFRLPAQGETKQAVEWDRKPSAPDQCQTPPAGNPAPDTYVVEVKSPGLPVARTSFVLKQD